MDKKDKNKVPILIKIFKKEEYLRDFINGKLYMNSNFYFSNYETQENMSAGQFDKYEGSEIILNSTEEKRFILKNLDNGEVCIVQAELDYDGPCIINAMLGRGHNIENILSMSGIWVDLINKKCDEIDSRMIDEFGEYCVIILDIEKFIHRVKNAVKSISYDINKGLRYGFVEYIDENESIVELGTFRKRKSYMYQNEFRIAIGIDREPKPLILDVGDLSDIVISEKTNKLCDININNDYLFIGDTKIKLLYK